MGRSARIGATHCLHRRDVRRARFDADPAQEWNTLVGWPGNLKPATTTESVAPCRVSV